MTGNTAQNAVGRGGWDYGNIDVNRSYRNLTKKAEGLFYPFSHLCLVNPGEMGAGGPCSRDRCESHLSDMYGICCGYAIKFCDGYTPLKSNDKSLADKVQNMESL